MKKLVLSIFSILLGFSALAQVTVNKGIYAKELITGDSVFVIDYKDIFEVESGRYPLDAEALESALSDALVLFCDENVNVQNEQLRDTSFLKLFAEQVPGQYQWVQYRAKKLGKSVGSSDEKVTVLWNDIKDLEAGGAGMIMISWDNVLKKAWEDIQEDYLEDNPKIKEVYKQLELQLADNFTAFEGPGDDVVFYPFTCKRCLNKVINKFVGSKEDINKSEIAEGE
ncbi:MAG TPA: hypothetical protein VFV37_05125 [Luteibaculaceae bacterium]|nr:hypothetical protein [Luteibaculaceae bacterium]